MLFSKIKLAVAAGLVSLAVAAGVAIAWQHRTIERLKLAEHDAVQRADQAEAQLYAERLARAAQTQARRKAEAKLKESNAALDQALKAAPDWAAEPVPPVIDDWLRDLHVKPQPAP